MEPWHRPRAPTRVWCLFEGSCTLLRGGVLQAVLGSAQQNDLRMNLSERFGELKTIVNDLDSRTADATGGEDKVKIFGSIEQLRGGYDALDEKIQTRTAALAMRSSRGVD